MLASGLYAFRMRHGTAAGPWVGRGGAATNRGDGEITHVSWDAQKSVGRRGKEQINSVFSFTSGRVYIILSGMTH